MKCGIYSTGYYVPENVITDEMVQPLLDTITEGPGVGITRGMLGVKESRFASEGETATDMGYKAALDAIKNAGIDKSEIDLIVYNSSTPDHVGSPDGYLMQDMLGIYNAASLTLTGGCSGFMSACQVGARFIECGTYKTVLVICSEVVSKAGNIKPDGKGIEISGAVNAGDAAAAVILKPLKTDEGGILSGDLGGDGRGYEVLMIPAGGMRMPATVENVKQGLNFARMDDKNFKYSDGDETSVSATVAFATKSFTKGLDAVLSKASLKKEDITWLIPHQPNKNIIDILVERYSIPNSKVLMTIDKYACPWSAATPLTLAVNNEEGRFKKGDIIAMVAFGGGFSYGALCFSWNDKEDFI